jgi:two-component sensor histidine kinase
MLDCEEVNLEIDTAISMGLIVNELLSNCLKHAFPGKKAVKL